MNRRLFNESLLESLTIPAGEREELLARAHTEGAAFATTLVLRGLLSPEALRRAYESLCGFSPFRGEGSEVRPVPAEILPLTFLRARLLVPVSLDDGTLVVAMADPLDAEARDAVAKATGRRVVVLAGTEEEVRETIEKMYGESGSSMERLVEQVGEEGEEIRTEGEDGAADLHHPAGDRERGRDDAAKPRIRGPRESAEAKN
jgi:hypothetical protein